MKKLALAGSALLVVAALSCTRELDIETPVSQEYVFEAVWADGSGTRTALQEDGTSVWWTTGEEINVFYGSIASGKFVSTNTEPVALTSFSGSLPVVTGTVEGGHSAPAFWGVYPYDAANTCDGESVTLTVPARQPATDGTFADKFFPAVAVSQDFALAFYNVCGGARFSVANTGIYAVTFEAVGGENLVGKVKVGFGSDGKPVVRQVSEGSAEVTVNAPAGGFVPGKYYFAAFLPGTLSQGLKVTYRTATQSASITQPNSLTVNRSRFGTIDRKDEGLTFVDGGGAEGGYAMPEAIDLGLSVKWASFNLGATKPEEYGNYYAWGETEPKEDYSWSTYKWCRGTGTSLTKYCFDPDYGYNGYTDGKTILDPEDDAATVNLGGNWRMPTASDFRELITKCNWTQITRNGVKGFKITSKIAGYTDKSIFLPAAGVFFGEQFGVDINPDLKDGAFYWSITQDPEEPKDAIGYVYYSAAESYAGLDYDDVQMNRCFGASIRPVYGASTILVESVSFDKSELTLVEGETAALTAMILPEQAIEQTLKWSSTDYNVAYYDEETGLVVAGVPGFAVITATSIDGMKVATCEVSIRNAVSVPEVVDLGLSVKWASFNLGATRPEEFGNYYAWGETETKEDYSWSTYKWYLDNETTFSKYCPYWDSHGKMKYDKTILDPEDDAATVLLGGNWRMPKHTEQEELRTKCTWTWDETKKGFTVTGSNGRSIFLPATGYMSGNDLQLTSYGLYWSSTLIPGGGGDNGDAYFYGFTPSITEWTLGFGYRYLGLPIRAVSD